MRASVSSASPSSFWNCNRNSCSGVIYLSIRLKELIEGQITEPQLSLEYVCLVRSPGRGGYVIMVGPFLLLPPIPLPPNSASSYSWLWVWPHGTLQFSLHRIVAVSASQSVWQHYTFGSILQHLQFKIECFVLGDSTECQLLFEGVFIPTVSALSFRNESTSCAS
jgi:hypothetical protein